MTKRLCLLVALLLGFASSGRAETKTDTIYFEYEPAKCNTGIVFEYYFSEEVASGIEIECGGFRRKPNAGFGSITDYVSCGKKGFWRVYYTYDQPKNYTVGLSEKAKYYTGDAYNVITNIKTDIYVYTKEANIKSSTLDVSGCANLVLLWCNNTKLTSIDVNGCASLRDLTCFSNQLTSLDVSNNIALRELFCGGNQLTELDVSKNTALTSLSCGANPLTSLDVSKNTALTGLACGENQLTELDVSGCTALTSLYCSNNQLTDLDVSKNTALKSLSCGDNELIDLDVSDCKALETLSFSNTPLTSLDVSGHTSLKRLECMNNQLTSLNASNCTSLKYFDCTKNPLASLNLSNCRSLDINYIEGRDWYQAKYWDWDSLRNLNISGWTQLKKLSYVPQLQELDVSGCTNLTQLGCFDNLLIRLNARGCTSLSVLWCYNNQLTELDVSGCINLEEFRCYNNQLTELDVSGCGWLGNLMCDNNQLTSLDVSGLYHLQSLSCYNNQLTSLDVSGLNYLKRLYCYNNQLTNLDVSGCWRLEDLYCYNNQLTSLDVSNNKQLRYLSAYGNHIPLSLLYKAYYPISNWNSFVANQSDTIAIGANQPLNLASERMLGDSVSTFEISDISGQTISFDSYTEDNFVFQFQNPGQYTLILQNQNLKNKTNNSGDTINGTPITFSLIVSVEEELPAGYVSAQVNANNPAWGKAMITGYGTYKEGTAVTITATPQEGGRFINWTKENGEVFSTEAEYTFTATEDLNLTANFEEMFAVNLSTNNPDYGSVSISGSGRYAAGTEVTITATPQEGGRFINWTKENGEVFSTEAEYTFTITEDLNLTANFEEIFTINLSANNPDYGGVLLTGNGIYMAGMEVTITAYPYWGYRFVNWTKEDGEVFSTEAEYTFTVTENMELIANFEEIPEKEMLTISLSCNEDQGFVRLSSNNWYVDRYDEGTEITITAYPYSDYRFVNWTKADGTVFSTEVEYTFTVTENLELIANFEKIPIFTISFHINNPEWGSINYFGGYFEGLEGDEITIACWPSDGYRFVNWTKADGSVFSTEAEYTFVITENLDLTANFEKISDIPDDDVANENREEDNFAVYVQERTIYLSEPRGRVQVFNVAGQCVYNGSSTVIPVPNSGVYIVKVGTRSYKVVVR